MTNETPADTLGLQLQRAGRRIATRHRTVPAWAHALAPALHRAARLTVGQGRFDRETASGAGTPRDWEATVGESPRTTAHPPARSDLLPRPVPADVRTRLRNLAGDAADRVRVHDDGAADAVARAHRADAVALGDDVHLRSGRFRPDEADGFALLAHEVMHVRASRARLRGAADEADPTEEDTARAVERTTATAPDGLRAGAPVRRGRPLRTQLPIAMLPPPPAPASTAHVAAPAPSSLPSLPADPETRGMSTRAAAMPQAASVDRPPPVPATAGVDLDALRRSVVADLTRLLRTEFERGG